MCGKGETEWKNLPIYSFYASDDNEENSVVFNRERETRITDSKICGGGTVYVDKSGCLVPRGLRFQDGVFILSSFSRTRHIAVEDVKSYNRIHMRIVIKTDLGFIEFNAKRIEDAKAIELILSGN